MVMNLRSESIPKIFAVWLICLFISWTPRAQAQEDDPGLIRALNTDSASVEDAAYLWAVLDNNTAPYHSLRLYAEENFKLAKDLGLVTEFPDLETRQPFGQETLALDPIEVFVRYEAFHFGGWSSETAGVLSFQGGGAYGNPNMEFPYIGSSWSLEVLGGYKIGPWFMQGNYGFQSGLDSHALSEWRADTALGYSLGSNWFIQGEADFYTIVAPFNDSSFSFVPQIAFQPGEWLFEFGEVFNESPSAWTEVLVARTF